MKMSNLLTEIGIYAFSSCISLVQIDIPSSVTTIGRNAFGECYSLEVVSFEQQSSLKTIREYGLCGCKSLKKLRIPNSVESIGFKAFEYCDSLKQITIPSKLNNNELKSSENFVSLSSILDNIVISPNVNVIL